jgi:hypothetical protein
LYLPEIQRVDSLLRIPSIIMLLQCKNNVRAMPRKASTTKTHCFTVTLPERAIVMIDQLVGIGLHGSSRAEVARFLILSRLEQLAGPSLISTSAQHTS